jgi:transcriptional regulator with XRE-family HTH domain
MPRSRTSGRPRTANLSGPGYALAAFLDTEWPSCVSGTNFEVAEVLGLHSPNLISEWRTGRSRVAARHLEGLANLLKVDLGKLLRLWIEQHRRDPAVPVSIADMLVDRLATTNEAELLMWVRGVTKDADPYFPADTLKRVCREISR